VRLDRSGEKVSSSAIHSRCVPGADCVRSTISVYVKIFKLAQGWLTFTLLILAVILQQAAQVVGSYMLVWWQEDSFNRSSAFCTFLSLLDLPNNR
jgi:cytochrome c oxidase subunit IV